MSGPARVARCVTRSPLSLCPPQEQTENQICLNQNIKTVSVSLFCLMCLIDNVCITTLLLVVLSVSLNYHSLVIMLWLHNLIPNNSQDSVASA